MVKSIGKAVGKVFSISTGSSVDKVESRTPPGAITVTKGSTTSGSVTMVGNKDSIIDINLPVTGGVGISTPIINASFSPSSTGIDFSIGVNTSNNSSTDLIFGIDSAYAYFGKQDNIEAEGISHGKYKRVNIHGAVLVFVVVAAVIELPALASAPAFSPILPTLL